MDLDLMDRYLAGEASPEEARAAEAWLGGADREALLGALEATAGSSTLDVDAAWRRLSHRLGDTRVASGPVRKALRFAGRRRAWAGTLRAAAVVAAVVGGSLLVRGALDGPESAGTGTVAAPGAPLRATLADGTRVVLAPGSVLRAPDAFGPASRDVELDGEAYFEVAPDPARPFAVRSERALTRVLGTRFAVRDVEGRPPRVSVVEGRVSFAPGSRPGREATVSAGEEGAIRSDGTVEVRAADVDGAIAFTEGRLVFRDEPLDRVVAEVSRWYGVDARVEDPGLASRRLTAAFAGEPARDVLEAVALAVGAEVRRAGGTFLIDTP